MRICLALVALMVWSGPATFGAAKKKKAIAPKPVAFSQAALDEIQDRALNGPTGLENPAGLVAFFEQILHPQEGLSNHILHYGDSHTASDDWPNAMRVQFQQKFGSGGAGFAFAGHPFKGYRRFDVMGANSLGWVTAGTTGHPDDERLGLGGISITARRASESVTFDAECQKLQLYYMTQPGGGDFVISVDGNLLKSVATEGDFAAAYLTIEAQPGPHRYAVKTASAKPVRLFGWTADQPGGLSYETLGINGAQAPMILDWDDGIFASNMDRRKPALIVLEYGTNEALNPRFTTEAYTQQFAAVLAKMRRAAPLASILVVGPPDCLKTMKPLPHIEEVLRVQRAVAAAAGCAFWDWRARMGGTGVVRQWERAGLGQPDHIHQTGAGYRMTASMLFRDLMQQYDRYVAARTE